ncbi:MAG: hypothetical protein HYW79_01250 [Parcubacteria group bacterium]|nr:hypothetical protein [Parcubacteria group bacterium]
MKVALVSCVKNKRDGRYKAKDIYISSLFRLAWKYASSHFDKVFILSAKHGLLEPSKLIRQYDVTLNNMAVCERKQWSRKVVKQIRRRIIKSAEIHFFCGKKYREFIVKLLQERKCIIPLKSLGIGKQLQWYKNRL